MECTVEANKVLCTCTYEGCSRKGKCCECVAYHRKNRQIPGCFFTREGEKSYDRSYRHFAEETA